jgi:hypothetical protein
MKTNEISAEKFKRERRRNSINYTKPEMTSLASASFVIQGNEKIFDPLVIDSQQIPDYITVPAYKGDE